MAYSSAGDWRSPGEQWVRTDIGWQPLTAVLSSQPSEVIRDSRDREKTHSEVAFSSPASLSRQCTPTPDSSADTKSVKLAQSISVEGPRVLDSTPLLSVDATSRVYDIDGACESKQNHPSCRGEDSRKQRPDLPLRCTVSDGKGLESQSVPTSGVAMWKSSEGSKSTAAVRQRMIEQRQERQKQLVSILHNSCVSSYTSSRESSNYATLSVSVTKLKFLEALHSPEYFPYICRVSMLIFKRYLSISGSLQSTLMKICQRAKDIALQTGDHLGSLETMLKTAITSLSTAISEQPYNIRTLQKRCTDLQHMLNEVQQLREELRGDVSVMYLPDDCLRCIISHLTHPQDIVALGSTCIKLHTLTEEQWVWKSLLIFYLGKKAVSDVERDWDTAEEGFPVQWKEQFIMEHSCSLRKRLPQRHEVCESVVSHCRLCSKVFWNRHGHPCIAESQVMMDRGSTERVTSDKFITLFAW